MVVSGSVEYPIPYACQLDFCNVGYMKVQDGWFVYDPRSIPRQLRFSLYSGAVITEGLM